MHLSLVIRVRCVKGGSTNTWPRTRSDADVYVPERHSDTAAEQRKTLAGCKCVQNARFWQSANVPYLDRHGRYESRRRVRHAAPRRSAPGIDRVALTPITFPHLPCSRSCASSQTMDPYARTRTRCLLPFADQTFRGKTGVFEFFLVGKIITTVIKKVTTRGSIHLLHQSRQYSSFHSLCKKKVSGRKMRNVYNSRSS